MALIIFELDDVLLKELNYYCATRRTFRTVVIYDAIQEYLKK